MTALAPNVTSDKWYLSEVQRSLETPASRQSLTDCEAQSMTVLLFSLKKSRKFSAGTDHKMFLKCCLSF